jgi:hypothetical protein
MPGGNLGYIVDAAKQPLHLQCLGASTIGVLAHVLYFIHWSDDRGAMSVVFGHFLALTLLVPLEVLSRGALNGLGAASLVFSAYLGSLFTSIFIYRVFFHRLRDFPGPFWAKVARCHAVYANRNGKVHEEYDKLIQEYGTFVRVGMCTPFLLLFWPFTHIAKSEKLNNRTRGDHAQLG